MWDGVITLVAEIRSCEKAGAIASAIAMAYICIDTMSFLSLPVDRNAQTRADFIAWVDTYLKGHPDQPYQYRGIDVYGARCAVLHAFSVQAEFHERNQDVVKFGYHDGGRHVYDPAVDKTFALIGTASFLNDVICAVETFGLACWSDADLRERAEARLPQVLTTLPFKK